MTWHPPRKAVSRSAGATSRQAGRRACSRATRKTWRECPTVFTGTPQEHPMNRTTFFRRRRAARPFNRLVTASPRAEALEPRTLLTFGALGPEFLANTITAGNQTQPAMAADGSGNFVVAWSGAGQDPASSEVYARRYSSAGVPAGDEFVVNTAT